MHEDAPSTEQQLQLVGMDASQAAAYVRLAVAGPMHAAELASALGVTRQETYRILHSMMARGFVVSDLDHPASFAATPPDEIFARALASQAARVEQLSRADESVKQALASMRARPPRIATPTFALVRGRQDILARAKTLIQSAQRELRLLSTHGATMNLADLSGIMPLILEKARRGVRVRAILHEKALADPRLAAAVDANVELRVLADAPSAGLSIADDATILLSFVSDPSHRVQADADVTLWSDAGDLVRLQTTLFDALWMQARVPTAAHPPMP